MNTKTKKAIQKKVEVKNKVDSVPLKIGDIVTVLVRAITLANAGKVTNLSNN